jgi:biopolymer transport protein ExbD
VSVKIRKGAALAALSITPLIDVVFLLLIFFLVATHFAEEDKELDLPLANASTAMPMNMRSAKFLNIDQQGRFIMDGRMMDPLEVEALLKALVRDNPVSQKVIINADRKSPAVVLAMDLCRKAQVAEMSIATEGD